MSQSQRLVDQNGWFEVRNNPISKVGVFQYLGKYIPGADPERIYSVYRPAEELGSEETIKSIKLMPWVNDHTMLGSIDDGLTPAENKVVHGVIGEQVYYKDGILYGNLKLFSDELSNYVDSGKKELSLGYRCKYKYQPGVFEGQPYEYIQYCIRGNHIASVQEGRMGPDVAVLDHFKFTFDTKDMSIMEESKAPEMTIEEALKAVTELLPILRKLAGVADDVVEAAQEVAETTEEVEETIEEVKSEVIEEAKEETAEVTEEAEEEKKEETVAMDFAAVLSHLAKRDSLARRLSKHIGTFDHAEMTTNQVAKYGLRKLGIKAKKGHEMTALDVYLQTVNSLPTAPISSRQSYATDSTHSFIDKYLKG